MHQTKPRTGVAGSELQADIITSSNNRKPTATETTSDFFSTVEFPPATTAPAACENE